MLSLPIFICIFLVNASILGYFIFHLKDFNSKLYLAVFTFFFYFYNGVGLAYIEISNILRAFYFVFYVFFASGFVLFYRLKIPLFQKIQFNFKNIRFESCKMIRFFAYGYIFLLCLQLIYPANIIGRLISPPIPDLLGTLNDYQPREDSNELVTKLLFYVQTLFFPFFFLHFDLLKKRKKIILFILLSTILNYFTYVKSAYISRSEILMYLQICFLVYFLQKQKISTRSVMLMLVPLASIILFFAAYQELRLGNDSEISSGVSQVLAKAFETEISFPKDVMQKVIDNKMTISFTSFLAWLFTLPIPKILIPNVVIFELNKNISEALLGIPADDQYFYILLPGLLGESLYIYGKFFFFIQAIFCGALFSFVLRLFKHNTRYYFFQAYLIVLMSYITCRGGIVSSLPALINGNLLVVFFFIFLKRISLQNKQKTNED